MPQLHLDQVGVGQLGAMPLTALHIRWGGVGQLGAMPQLPFTIYALHAMTGTIFVHVRRTPFFAYFLFKVEIGETFFTCVVTLLCDSYPPSTTLHQLCHAPPLPPPNTLCTMQAVRRVSGSSLVLLLPVTTFITAEALNRVRMNTILSWQVRYYSHLLSVLLLGFYYYNSHCVL